MTRTDDPNRSTNPLHDEARSEATDRPAFKIRAFRALDVLCAIFCHTREHGPISETQLAERLGLRAPELAAQLGALRAVGLIQDDEPRLTFLGLTTAVSELPKSIWAEFPEELANFTSFAA